MVVQDALSEAVAHHKRGKWPEAEAAYRHVLTADPDNLQAHNNLGSVYQQQGLFGAAAECFRHAVDCAPQSFAAQFNLGLALHELGEVEQAAHHYRAAMSLKTAHPDLHLSLGNACQELGQFSEALTEYDAAIQLNPAHAEAQWNRAIVLLQTGDWARGWTAHEWRWYAQGRPARPKLPQREWDGSPLSRKTLLVYGEQGVGDEIMFANCLPDVVAQAGHCLIATAPRLERLFRRSFAPAEVRGVRGPADVQELAADAKIDFQAAIGSLPRYLRPSLESCPRRPAYLTSDRRQSGQWRERLLDVLGPGPKIGISWRGGAAARERRKRATTLRQWGPILAAPKCHFISLQHGTNEPELRASVNMFGTMIHSFPDVDPAGDLDDFAALISALDLVITVGNTTAHLAGALGVRGWTLLPYAWGWRWLIGREDSPWYSNMRLFRQRQFGDWREVIKGVARELEKITSN